MENTSVKGRQSFRLGYGSWILVSIPSFDSTCRRVACLCSVCLQSKTARSDSMRISRGRLATIRSFRGIIHIRTFPGCLVLPFKHLPCEKLLANLAGYREGGQTAKCCTIPLTEDDTPEGKHSFHQMHSWSDSVIVLGGHSSFRPQVWIHQQSSCMPSV
jgi:hypothetical protein